MPTDHDDPAKDDEESGPVTDAEYYDSAASRLDRLDGVLPDRGEQLPQDDDGPEGSSTARSDERTTLTQTEQTQRSLEEDAAEDVGADGGSSDPADDNLIQLPMGAEFRMDHQPTPQEREDLVRFAAQANRELHGQDEGENL